ncbi:hypothetical protein PR048_011764 [Dryococelus australis]|uniref:HTH CENPB-type domain-containing protein n=1 Tax=Dryococelus australis TaxID=614101 RepID=A0ABQ9HMJ6_9NEOP|nr:hypothetical protein PR048_011764 [Dryococelus australis]
MCSSDTVKKRKIISLETKLEVIRRAYAHEGYRYISCTLGLICVSQIQLVVAETLFDVRYWNRSINKAVILAKALLNFDQLKNKYRESDTNFTASKGWFEKFVHRYNLNSIKKKGDAASVDKNTSGNFLAILEDTIAEEGYSLQVYDADETGDNRVQFSWSVEKNYALSLLKNSRGLNHLENVTVDKLTAEEIIENDEQCYATHEEEKLNPGENLTKDTAEFFTLVNKAFSVLDENDPNKEKRTAVIQGIK